MLGIEGEHVYFVAGESLLRVSLEAGPVQTLATGLVGDPIGWCSDGVLVWNERMGCAAEGCVGTLSWIPLAGGDVGEVRKVTFDHLLRGLRGVNRWR